MRDFDSAVSTAAIAAPVELRGAHHLRELIFAIAAVSTLFPFVPASAALFLGVALALTIENPWAAHTKKLTPKLLSLSVMGIGAGMNLSVIAQVGLQSAGYIIAAISIALALGTILGRALKTDHDISI